MSDAGSPPSPFAPGPVRAPDQGAPSSSAPSPGAPAGPEGREVLLPDNVRQAGAGAEGEAAEEEKAEVESPAKIIRIGAMLKQLLEEARNLELDEAARVQLGAIYGHAIDQLKTAMSDELGEELEDLSFDFSPDSAPTEAELRMAKAQLVGWLEGLFHGIQATLMAQQMAARQQLEGMRAQLPERSGPPPGPGYI